ncbi:MAG: 4Fe-4S dicluster domain-containing protein [Candidatus Bathyarchaeia archaeon]
MAIRPVPPAKLRLRFDAETCWWCRCCELVCSLTHEGVCSPALSRIHIDLDQFKAEVKAGLCWQCGKPLCLYACPVPGAMTVDEATGARLIVPEKCTGCGVCAKACPFNKEGTVIRLNAERGIYVKCDLCGGQPACVETCPVNAIQTVTLKSA